MLAEERADTIGSKISHAIVAVSRQDDGVREDNLVLVDAALEIAQDELAACDVVAEVTEGLHDLSPRLRVVAPSGVAVELLIVLDEGFA